MLELTPQNMASVKILHRRNFTLNGKSCDADQIVPFTHYTLLNKTLIAQVKQLERVIKYKIYTFGKLD